MRLPSLKASGPLRSLLVLAAAFIGGAICFENFASTQVVAALLGDNAFVGIAAVGATFVLVGGGIDLSVGALIAFTSVLIARLIETHHLHPGIAFLAALCAGTLFGTTQGFLIRRFELPPFLVTLAGMFFVRALGFCLESEARALKHEFFGELWRYRIPLGGQARLSPPAVLWALSVALGALVLGRTMFGRTLHALGDDAQAARSMGLAVERTSIASYAVAGAFSAFAGVAFAIYTQSGNPAAAVGLELDVIAAVVIGGTALSGGSGTMLGTASGVLLLGIIQTAINFHGDLSSWWTRIVVGGLVFLFVAVDRLLGRGKEAT